jgi:hypothetical protein
MVQEHSVEHDRAECARIDQQPLEVELSLSDLPYWHGQPCGHVSFLGRQQPSQVGLDG